MLPSPTPIAAGSTPAPPPEPPLTSRDAERVARILGGDEGAFLELVEELHGGLIRLAMLYVRRRELAEEVVQDTWVAVLEGLTRFEGRSSLKTWISRIVTNQAKTRAVREARSVPFSSFADAANRELAEPHHAIEPGRFHASHDFAQLQLAGHWREPPRSWDAGSPEAKVASGEAMRYLGTALEALPEAQRTVVVLRDVEGWDTDEVCAALGVSEVNQRVLLHRGRTRLRKALELHFSETPATSEPGATRRRRDGHP